MGPSPAPTYSEPLVPQSQAQASLPAEVTVEDAEEGEDAGGSGTQAPKPSSMKRYKQTAKRIVKRPPACKSPFVAQCVKQFPKIPHADRVVADYALAEMGDPSEILCDMYGMYIRREELSCLNAGRWVNSMVDCCDCLSHDEWTTSTTTSRTFFEPSFSVVLSNLKSNATTQVILERCAMYLDPDTLGHDLSSCDMMFIPVCENNHWHVHVVNFAAGRVEILSSLPLRRGNNISAATRRLSMALHKALHAYRIHMDVDVSSFVHVQPHLLQQLNGFDCGILALKFMEFWNGATLTTSVAVDKTNMYRLQLVLQLVLNERNSVRDTIMAACHL
ncbi:putative ubiquitin-like-specific protease 1B [Vitis riparia]|uniref:putative ubiquitin-like-specific protease 1B n=1 Tax=Vitis riparia TaxID=96939 RepID=UPI00155AB622|nr:putative ubiquitin-like-specific protease 1B [Vitis riparia]